MINSVFLCVLLVAINWQTSYDSSILRQYEVSLVTSFGNPRITPVSFVKAMGSYEVFADESYEVCQLGTHLGSTLDLSLRTETCGLTTVSEQTAGSAVLQIKLTQFATLKQRLITSMKLCIVSTMLELMRTS